MTVVLDMLSPAERLAYVLKDVFAVPFEQIAPILGRSEVATRQLAGRARRRLREPEPREDLAAADAAVVDAFMAAVARQRVRCAPRAPRPRAAEVLTDQAAADDGGRRRHFPPQGNPEIAELFAGRAKAALPATLDGGAASCWQHLGEVKVVFAFTVVDGRVRQIELLADPVRAHACGPTLTGPTVRLGRRPRRSRPADVPAPPGRAKPAFDNRRNGSTVTVTRRPERFWCQTPATTPSTSSTG